MYDSLNPTMKTIADRYIDIFKNATVLEFRSELENMLSSIKENDGLEASDNQIYRMSDEEKLDLFKAIYENMSDEQAKGHFINGMLDYSSLAYDINPAILEYFEAKANEYEGQDLGGSDHHETEEQNLEEQETIIEGPEITKYKQDTEEIRQTLIAKLEELENLKKSNELTSDVEEKVNELEPIKTTEEPINELVQEEDANSYDSTPEIENNELDELIAEIDYDRILEDNKKIKEIDTALVKLNKEKNIFESRKKDFLEKNPDYRKFEDKLIEYDLIENDITRNKESIEKLETEKRAILIRPHESDNRIVMVQVSRLNNLYQIEIDRLQKHRQTLEYIVDKYYNDAMNPPYYIINDMDKQLRELITKMKNDFHEVCGISSTIKLNKPENLVLIENVYAARELDKIMAKEINEKFKDDLPKKEDNLEKPHEGNDLSNPTSKNNLEDPKKENNNEEKIKKLESEINGMKDDFLERYKNVDTYYKALDDINRISNEKDKDSEAVKQLTESAQEKINSITNDDLKRELNQYLEKALAKKIEKVKKDPNKWKKWVAGIAGFVVGGATVAFVPGAAMGVIIGSQLAKKAVKLYHNHLKKKAAELPKENEVTNIEQANEKQRNIAKKFKEFMMNEDNIRNINWFLNGVTIGAATVRIVDAITPDTPVNGTNPSPTPNPTPNPSPTPTDPYSQIKIGDSASGLDLTQGYDQANWAANNMNVESLNQAIMHDGNSVINSVAVVKDGGTQIIDVAGKSLAEIAQQYGVSPEDLVLNIGNQQGAARAWVDVGEAVVGRTI